MSYTRRQFLESTSALGAASLLGYSRIAAAEPPPETKKIRLVHAPAICLAPQYLAAELLRLEGFTEVSYVDMISGNVFDGIYSGRADLTMDAAPAIVYAMDSRPSLVALAGIHAGCYELFGNARVKAISDLKGKTVSVFTLGGADHVLLASMLAYVGIDPRRDVNWIVGDKNMDAMRLFVEGKSDAFMGFPRRRKSFARRRSDTSSSTRRKTGLGRSISAACLSVIRNSSQRIRSRQSAPYAHTSKPPISARRSLSALLASSPLRATSRATRSGWMC